MLVAASVADMARSRPPEGPVRRRGTVMAFNTPAWQVLTRRVGAAVVDLTKAITLMGIQFNASRVVGPGAGGDAFERARGPRLFTINTVTFLAVVVAVLFSPNSPAPTRAGRRAIEQMRGGDEFHLRRAWPVPGLPGDRVHGFRRAPGADVPPVRHQRVPPEG